MKTFTTTLHVDAPPEIAFACVVDPEAMTESRTATYTLLEQTPETTGTQIHYQHGLFGGTLTLTDEVPSEQVTFEWHGPERFVTGDLRGHWTFAPQDGGTTITIRSEFDTRLPVLHALAARAMIRSFREKELPTLKEQIETRAARSDA